MRRAVLSLLIALGATAATALPAPAAAAPAAEPSAATPTPAAAQPAAAQPTTAQLSAAAQPSAATQPPANRQPSAAAQPPTTQPTAEQLSAVAQPSAATQPPATRQPSAAAQPSAATQLPPARQPAAAAQPAARPPLLGCGTAPPVEPGTTAAREVTSGGVTRRYLVHLPADYDSHRPLPVLLSFHGHTRTAEYQERLSGFSELDAIAVYPQGLVGTDGETAWQGAPYSSGADDVRFTRDLLDDVQSSLCADPRRIYAAGKSNGGGFTDVLACRLGDRIAAFAPVSGAYYPERGACSPARPVPVISFHGTDDDTIPYEGDPSRGLPPIPEWLAGWAQRDRCAPQPATERPQPQVTVQRWERCAGRGELVHYRIDGLGHDWPSRSPNPDSDRPAVIEATPLIWEFFQRHPLGA